jgi:hypothetical protein
MPPKTADKIEKEVRAVAKQPGNKVCVDCPEKVCGVWKCVVHVHRLIFFS